MSSGTTLTESTQGYLSEGSKRRFTLAAGVLGAVFFVAQVVVPMVVMFAVMIPAMIGSEVMTADLDQAVLWRGDLWLVQSTIRLSLREGNQSTTRRLVHLGLADLSEAGPSLPLDPGEEDRDLFLLPEGDRLWVIGDDAVSYLEGTSSLTRANRAKRPARASRPFVYKGRPAVVSLGSPPTLVTLETDGGKLAWTAAGPLPLGLPTEEGALRAFQGLELGGRTYLFAELCTEAPQQCSLRYRDIEQDQWLPLVEGACACSRWTAVALGASPAVVLSERERAASPQVSVVTATAAGPRRERIETKDLGAMTSYRRALSQGSRLLLLFDGMPGSLKLLEVADGKGLRAVRRPGAFPFWSANMMLLMALPQLLPILLSLVLAFLLSIQMSRHRVQEYMLGGKRRRFATVWQRALAQLVDLVPFAVAFIPGWLWMRRMFSDPESLFESGFAFPFVIVGWFAAALLWGVLVLVGFSYLEGRFGKTPGKWLLGIRVLGTDLQPCGFVRAFLRNLLTFVDGFFNFLVGAMLVALTENWQRLGDLAARTIVVVDEGE